MKYSKYYSCKNQNIPTFWIAERYYHIQSILNNTSSTVHRMKNNIDVSLGVEILEK